jgi:hypothetical protein
MIHFFSGFRSGSRPLVVAYARSTLGVALCCLIGLTAQADEEAGATSDSWVELSFLNQFDADFDDDDGTFDVRGGSGRAQFMIRLDDRVRVRTRTSYYGVSYEYDDPPTIAGSEFKPFNTIHVARLNPMLDVEVAEGWLVFGGPLMEASLENSADLANGLRFGGLLGAEYTVSPELSVGAGLIGMSEIEDDFYLQPLLLLDWRPIDRLSVHAESWTTRGGRVEVAYRVLDQLELGTSLSYRRERFRLKQRVVAPGPPPVPRTGNRGVAEDRAVIPAVRISYLPDADFIRDTLGDLRLDLEAGVALAGDVRIEDRNGSKIQTMSYDPAPILELKIMIPL